MKRLAVTLLLGLAAHVLAAETPPTGRSTASVLVPTACTPDDATYCANNGRFSVQVIFSAPILGIVDAPAHAASLTSDTGYFWFFSPNNVELVVKVVDGRAFNGFFWVFYGALSDVAYRVTVTDTATGAVKTYTNAAGSLASVADTAAFAGGPAACTFVAGTPNPGSFGSAGGSGTVSITTQSGCSWTAVSNSTFVTVTSGASGTGNGTVTFSVAANPSGSSRTGSLTVGGQLVSITQAGTAPGQLDGAWAGTTSQTCDPDDGPAHLCALRWIISSNAFTRLDVGFAGPSCGVLDGFTSVTFDPPQPIVGTTFELNATATPSAGVSATIMLNGRFDSTSMATGSGSVRLTTSSPLPNCTTTVPVGFTAVN